MSTLKLPAAGHGPDADEAHEPFDPEPVRSLPPDEAPSPLWLPAVGAAVVLLAAVAWMLTGGEPDAAAGSAAAGASAAAQTAASASARVPVPTAAVDARPVRPADPRKAADRRRLMRPDRPPPPRPLPTDR